MNKPDRRLLFFLTLCSVLFFGGCPRTQLENSAPDPTSRDTLAAGVTPATELTTEGTMVIYPAIVAQQTGALSLYFTVACAEHSGIRIDDSPQSLMEPSDQASSVKLILGEEIEGNTIYYGYYADDYAKEKAKSLAGELNNFLAFFLGTTPEALHPNERFEALRHDDPRRLISVLSNDTVDKALKLEMALIPSRPLWKQEEALNQLVTQAAGVLGYRCDAASETTGKPALASTEPSVRESTVAFVYDPGDGAKRYEIQVASRVTNLFSGKASYQIIEVDPGNLPFKTKKAGVVWNEAIRRALPRNETTYYPEAPFLDKEPTAGGGVAYHFVPDVAMIGIHPYRIVLAVEGRDVVGIALAQRWWSREGRSYLIDVLDVDPLVDLDLKYATEDNFLGRVLYEENRALLTPETAQALKRANTYLKEQGYRLRLWDAYRPLRVQWTMWKALTPEERRGYVADPHTGSCHNRGAAVDVTMVDETGREVLMPTGFDDFSERAAAHHTTGLDALAVEYREILKATMKKAGFTGIESEWWHFDGPDGKNARQNHDFALSNHPR